MSKNLFSQFIIIGILLMLSTIYSFAATININARHNDFNQPIVEFFTAGEYEIIPIGIADGGRFNAWNAWGYAYPGWLNAYSLSSNEFTLNLGTYEVYQTDLAAFAKAEGAHFNLNLDGFVKFYIQDNPITDNIGGVSLQVIPALKPNPVPIPSAIWLFSAGIISLFGISRKPKSLK